MFATLDSTKTEMTALPILVPVPTVIQPLELPVLTIKMSPVQTLDVLLVSTSKLQTVRVNKMSVVATMEQLSPEPSVLLIMLISVLLTDVLLDFTLIAMLVSRLPVLVMMVFLLLEPIVLTIMRLIVTLTDVSMDSILKFQIIHARLTFVAVLMDKKPLVLTVSMTVMPSA
jgi:hypothetical protein